ncbi:gastrula zinc finger protein XlCGF57.1-like isoform X2 [Watersipora subatra]|uniref:gastrula zinc finger protein XlCGF57.1-like isoform X2 n=1 Tax=Watersipora subatra TaxID=2589382 RepID=UPI00355C6BB6
MWMSKHIMLYWHIFLFPCYRKRAQRFQPPATNLQMEMTAAVENFDKVLETDIMVDDIDSLATLNVDIKLEADKNFDPNSFDCHSDVSDESDEDFKPHKNSKKRKTSSKRKAKPKGYCEDCQLETIGDSILHPLLPIYDTQVTGQVPHYIDGEDIERANWLRYVNSARFRQEQNLEAFQQQGKIYYKALFDISKGNELLVWYGDDYATDLGVNKEEYAAISTPPVDSLDCMKYARDIAATLKCEECDFNSTFNHQSTNTCTAHTSSTEKPYACTQCDYRSVQRGSLQSHMKAHTGDKPYACTQCDYRFAHRSNLPRHMKTHTGEKPYACTQCDYRCAQSGSLQSHMKAHTGDKPYACTQCDYRFAHRSNLPRHMKTHTGEKPYACTQCDHRSADKGDLQRHVKTHTGEKPYACTQCDYRCAHRCNLQRHMKTHTGEKPYACTQCDYRCAQSGSLQSHMKAHTGDKPYACTQCDYRCAHRCNLQRHVKTHTGEKPYA